MSSSNTFSTIPAPGTQGDLDAMYGEYVSLNEAQRTAYFNQLSNNQKKKLTKRVNDQSQTTDVPDPTDDEDEEDEFPMPKVMTPPTTVVTERTESKTEITDDQLRDMWTMIESMSSSEIDPEDLRVFEYEGFNPSAILKSMMLRKMSEKVSNEQFKTDIMILCGLAIIKGSINENNFKKMKKAGQDIYTRLAERYTIKMGSARGMEANYVTVSRIAAAFPGVIIDLLYNNKVSARVFGGPMKSSKLPAVMRHQAMAACVPKELGEPTKNFILGTITGFSVDQSLTLGSKKKVKKEDVIVDQANFIRVAHGSAFPSEAIRKAIFQKIPWRKHYDEMRACAIEVEKLDDTFGIVLVDQLAADINRI
jgi:hypothetical protein